MNWREEAKRSVNFWRVKRDEAFARHGLTSDNVCGKIATVDLPPDCIIPACYVWAFESIAKLPQPSPIKSVSEAASGVCRVCGCTQGSACPGGCRWTDLDRTLCSNPRCTRIASVIDMIEVCAKVADEAAKLSRPAHMQQGNEDGAYEMAADKIDDVAEEIRKLPAAFLENC